MLFGLVGLGGFSVHSWHVPGHARSHAHGALLLLCWLCVRRRATTTINDGASIADTLNTPRSSIDPVSQEVLLDLLDTWGAR